MGMRVSLAFFSVLAQGKARKNPKNFGQVPGRTDRNCGGSTALFFFFLAWGLNLEQVLVYRKCGEGIALFFSFCGLNMKQVLGRGYTKCGGSTALFFFFGTGVGV